MNTTRSLQWLVDTDAHISQCAGAMRSSLLNTSGVISGFSIERIAGTPALRVYPGTAVVDGFYCELLGIYDGLIPSQIYNGEFFIVLTVVTSQTSVLNTYQESTVASEDYSYTLQLVRADTYTVSRRSLVLGQCMYTITDRNPDVDPNAVIQLPNIFGVFADLAAASDPYITSELHTGDSVAVRNVSNPGTPLEQETLAIYTWGKVVDPVQLTVPHPISGLPINVMALWGTQGIPGVIASVVGAAPTLHYLVDGYSTPGNPSGAFEVVAYDHEYQLTSGISGITAEYFYSLIGIDIHIDTTTIRYDFIRTQYSGLDNYHRSKHGVYTASNNAHGVGFSDLTPDKMPLHKQLFDSGFGIAGQETHGIVGVLYSESIDNINIRVDFFGDVTGIINNRYLRLQHIPVGVSQLRIAGNDIAVAYTLINDVVALGADYEGGSFRTYPMFVRTVNYMPGDRVYRTDSVGIDHLYVAIQPWFQHTTYEEDGFDPSFFFELLRYDLDVDYYYIADLEYSTSSDNSIYVSPNTKNSIVTDGIVVDPTSSSDLKQFSLGAYKAIPLSKITLSFDSTGNLVASDRVVDRADLSVRKSNQQNFNADLGSPAQIKIYVSNTPRTYEIPVPDGTLVVTSNAFYGHYRMFYTYWLDDRTLFTTNSQLSEYTEDLNLASAQLVEDVNIIPRDSWEYSPTEYKVIISGDVYRAGHQYKLVRRFTETSRNRRGFIDVVGTGPKPAGTKSTASLQITEYARLANGDSITIILPDATSITKTQQDVAGFTGYKLGLGAVATASNIVAAFHLDPVFIASGMTVVAHTSSGSTSIVFTSGIAGTLGNTNKLVVTSVNTSMRVVSDFTGGADHVFAFTDLIGLGFSITDHRTPDIGGYFSVWSTANIDDAATDANKFYRIASVKDDYSGSVLGSVLTSDDLVGVTDTYDAAKELQLSVQITGTDVEGSTISEILNIDCSDFCDIQNYRVDNYYSNVRSRNLYSSLTSWACLSSQNVGSSNLAIVSESASGTRDLFDICDLSWTGSGVKWIRDRRMFIDASTNRPVSNVSAEALSNVAALIQFNLQQLYPTI